MSVKWKICLLWGKNPRSRKRTKVKARIVAQSLEELISETDRVMIMGHSNPDMDVMGAALGIYRLAKEMGKRSLYCQSKIRPLELSTF